MARGSIQEIFSTVAIGLFFVMFIAYLVYQFYVINSLNSSGKKKKKHKVVSFKDWILNSISDVNSHGATSLFVFLIMIYAVGQLIEDFTDHLTDASNPKFFIPRIAEGVLGSEDTHRLNTVLDVDSNKVSCNKLGATIFKDKSLMSNIIVKLDCSDTLFDAEQFLNFPNHVIQNYNSKNLYGSCVLAMVNLVYYKSKNWCYKQATYFNELELIQRRINFARSACLVSVFFIVVLIVYLIFLLTRFSLFKSKDKKIFESFKKLVVGNILLFVFLIFFTLISKYSYKITEENFNERVLGYYVNHIESENTISKDKMIKEWSVINSKLDSLMHIMNGK